VSDAPINIRIAVFADEARTRHLGSEETFLLFTNAERETFLKTAFREGRNTLMTGWPEMGHPDQNVPGTLADAELQTDIQLLLWKEESKQHRDCTHESSRAEPAPADSSSIIAAMLAGDSAAATSARNLLERSRDTGQTGLVRLERWYVRSCDALTAYEVLLLASPGGGTDIIVRQAGEQAGGGSAPTR
jgi:hypothetical protein